MSGLCGSLGVHWDIFATPEAKKNGILSLEGVTFFELIEFFKDQHEDF